MRPEGRQYRIGTVRRAQTGSRTFSALVIHPPICQTCGLIHQAAGKPQHVSRVKFKTEAALGLLQPGNQGRIPRVMVGLPNGKRSDIFADSTVWACEELRANFGVMGKVRILSNFRLIAIECPLFHVTRIAHDGRAQVSVGMTCSVVSFGHPSILTTSYIP